MKSYCANFWDTTLELGGAAHQGFERVDVGQVVERLIDGSFGKEGGVGGGDVQEAAEKLEADASLPDVLVTIEPGSAFGFGIIAVPDGNVGEADEDSIWLRVWRYPGRLTMSYPATWVWQVSMQAATGTSGRSRSSNSATCSKLAPSEYRSRRCFQSGW